MTSKIEELIEHYAIHLAHKRGESVAELRAYVHALFERTQQEYRAAGSPRGEGEDAFLAWLDEQPLLAKTA